MSLLFVSLAYFLDASNASAEVRNLILIAPVTFLVFLLCVVEFVRQLSDSSDVQLDQEPISSVAPAILLFATYVALLPWLGFDVGTFLFITTYLVFHGERRWPWALGYGVCFALAISVFFSAMLPYPMPMLLLATEY